MVRFSCFSHIHCHKPKKTVDDFSQGIDNKDAFNSKSFNSPFLRSRNVQADEISKPAGSVTPERWWKSEEVEGKLSFGPDHRKLQLRCLKKSQSFGDELYLNGRAATEIHSDDDHIVSLNSPDRNGSVIPDSGQYIEGISSGLYQTIPHKSVSAHLGSDQVNNESVLSTGDMHHHDKESQWCSDSFSGDGTNDSNNQTKSSSPVIVKSNSMPNIADSASDPERFSPVSCLAIEYGSSDDLDVLDMRQKEMPVFDTEARPEQEQDDVIRKPENSDLENLKDYGYDCYDHSSLTKDWIVPVTTELESRKHLEGESFIQPLDEMTGKDFKNKCIQEWVNDLQHFSILNEVNVLQDYDDEAPKESIKLDPIAASKEVLKLTSGMEAATKYISSLSASATAANLVNHGLVVIPFLSAFVSLRALNLSGNAIVRITAGTLPQGLHTLNLSKNSITSIEGLRGLTRLRALDLSYNRILRIGHGLASCSCLKELYLAGNKISEVEGLHRLLKLTVLDLRFNKISTTKCLTQLAANYNSLQAISLEGNPAQKNVGDEQLKKYLLGNLPHLVYFNRQAIKNIPLKDAAERSIRLGRSDPKGTRKSNHVAATTHKRSSSSSANKISALQKRSKDRNGSLPPNGVKGSAPHQSRYGVDSWNGALNMRSELSIHKSRSEGFLGAV